MAWHFMLTALVLHNETNWEPVRTLVTLATLATAVSIDDLWHWSEHSSQRLLGWSSFLSSLPVPVLPASTCNTSTTQTQPHQISNTQRTENKMTDVVIQQHSRKLLKMDILMSETCWAHKKWNIIASDIKLVFHSSSLINWSFDQFLPLVVFPVKKT